MAFSATYLGNRTVHLLIGDNLNPLVYIPGTVGGGSCTIGAARGVYVGGQYNGISDGLTSGSASTGCSTATD